MANLGYVGLGAMGGGVASRLIDKGHSVTGYTRTRAKVQWLIDKGVSMIAADNWGVEVLPAGDPSLSFPCHQLCLTMNGVYLFENLNFDAVANDGVFQAAFFFSPLPIKGATGSPGNPILIV